MFGGENQGFETGRVKRCHESCALRVYDHMKEKNQSDVYIYI